VPTTFQPVTPKRVDKISMGSPLRGSLNTALSLLAVLQWLHSLPLQWCIKFNLSFLTYYESCILCSLISCRNYILKSFCFCPYIASIILLRQFTLNLFVSCLFHVGAPTIWHSLVSSICLSQTTFLLRKHSENLFVLYMHLNDSQFGSWIKRHEEWPVLQTWPSSSLFGVILDRTSLR